MSEQQLAIPEHLKKYQAQSSVDADSLASSSISIPRVSLRGRKFRLVVGGEEIRKPSDELDVVILAVEPGPNLFIKTYYEGKYNSGDSAPPSCASSNGVAPDPWVTNPQAERCMTCPKNQFGSATSNSGKKTKACRDSKRLWVTDPTDVEGTVFALGIPVTSLKSVAEYGRMIRANGVPLSAVITRLTMVDSEFPQLEFQHVGFLDEQVAPIAMERAEVKNWDIGGASKAPQLGHEQSEPGKVLQAPGAKEVAAQLDAPKETDGKPSTVNEVVGNW